MFIGRVNIFYIKGPQTYYPRNEEEIVTEIQGFVVNQKNSGLLIKAKWDISINY